MRIAFTFAVLALATTAATHAAMIQSTFDSDLDGWSVQGSAGEWHSSGGNPDGYLYVDNSEGPVTYVNAPSKFLGDISAYNGQTLFFDAIQIDDGGQPWDNFENFGRLTIWFGALPAATVDLVPGTIGPPPTWTRYSIPLTAGAWGVSSESDWLFFLSNVSFINLSVEGLFGAEINGIDNFTITPEPASLPIIILGSLALLRRKR